MITEVSLKLSTFIILFQSVTEFLTYIEPLDSVEDWVAMANQSWQALVAPFLTEEEQEIAQEIISTICYSMTRPPDTQTKSLEERMKRVEELLALPQIQQRSEEWYLDGDQTLTASQFSTLFKGLRTRGQLVLEKAGLIPKPPRSNILASRVETSSPFDWGIRFEPVVKQIYCDITKTEVAEIGRLKHKTEKYLAASPDGLVVSGLQDTLRVGRFVEFKAPVTRALIQEVPEDYYIQMQIQMEVGDVDLCDYFEVKFKSAYGKNKDISSLTPTHSFSDPYYGVILLIASADNLRYEYSPLNVTSWTATTLQEGEEVIQEIPWSTSSWWLKTVERSKSWFESIKPSIEAFWLDVEKARAGEFTLPESTRKPKKTACLIMAEEKEVIPLTTDSS